MKITKKRLLKWGSNLVSFVLFLGLVTMATIVITTKASGGEPELFGLQFKTVLSGSMEPGIQTGSVIAVETGGDMTRFQEDDVITFMEEDSKLVTHRITEVLNNGEHIMYETKGDNNNAADINPVFAENVVAEYTGFTVPYLGYLVSFAQTQNGAFLLLIPGILLLGYAVITIWQGLRELERNQKAFHDDKEDKQIAT
ncbi:signal peptidase I SipW [Oceanobacillus iheyensis]|uniref:Signal peptidase I n=1 Tax=Oceanobacillus iheyensis (strain DSM 14371 / CIP 107618 / JCM 11309 / KCTC 3954 / HTE831) TaxID=221109 RepID=Q8ENF7_OCEIH|nr:signal peptidase I [Oceanobacillus iheyensis]BAC14482.1 signal peptidase I [Oceanobacillus iheyensis HTE831]